MEFIYDSREYWNKLKALLPGKDKVWIATYGLKGPEYTRWPEHPVNQVLKSLDPNPTDFKIVIGYPYVGDCHYYCRDCEELRVDIKRTIDSNADYLRQRYCAVVKTTKDFHMKLIVTESFVIMGGRNLTGSKWIDLSVVSFKKNDIRQASKIFEQMWRTI